MTTADYCFIMYLQTCHVSTNSENTVKMKKQALFIIIITVVVCAVIGASVFLAMRHRKYDSAPPITLYVEYNNKILWPSGSFIDSENDVIVDVDFDLSEFGITDFDNKYIRIGNVENYILYFSCRLRDSGVTRFFKLNTLTDQISEIVYTSELSFVFYSDFFAADGYLYYFARKSAEFNENEVRYCCRIPVNGGAEEILTEYEYSLNPLNICFVADEMIIFINGETILGYDIKKDKMITLWNSEANGYVWVGSLQYYNGNIYFLAMANRGDPDEDNVPKDDRFLEEWGSAGHSYLYSLNIKTKKAARISDTPICSFYLTKDEIFFIKKAYGVIEKDGKLMPTYNTDEVYSFDLNGKNENILVNGVNLFIADIISVRDNKIYVMDGNAETARVAYAVIDRATGKIKTVRWKE